MITCDFVEDMEHSTKRYSVVVADDVDRVRTYFAKQFRIDGHDVTEAAGIEQLQGILAQQHCDLLVLNLEICEQYPTELLERIKAYTDAHIIVLTSQSNKESTDELFEYGIINYYVTTLPLKQIYRDIIDEMYKLERNKNFSVAIVENSAKIQKQLRQLLEPRGLELLIAPDAKNFFDDLKGFHPDLILLDTALPDMQPGKVLERVYRDLKLTIPTLLISDSEDMNLLSRLFKEGARDYVKKPFILEELLLKIDMWVQMTFGSYQRECKEKLLNEYKDAIDESTIVSKTDRRGVITYVNQAFCDISGYTQEELLGKPHNIVRHKDMPKSAFKDMWETIKGKKTWRGIVKNRRKDGGFYFVDTIIKPIIDSGGKITEYIGIRTDITEIQKIKERLEKDLNITSKNFKEAMALSKEYEKALDESTIVSRTNLDGEIVYANERFYETTGFPPQEVLGKTHRIVRHPDNSEAFYEQMWDTITSGRIWKGVIKNLRKDKTEYVVNSMIYPIKDSSGKTIEYMAIRNDITDIITLHREIEDTQREVIFKMGAVGESRSKETGDHVRRVADYSQLLARKAGLEEEEAQLLKDASPMHDIGKVGIPDSILLKPGKLTAQEYEQMKTHTEIGYNILKESKRELLQTAAIVAYEHHEKWDGSGYPRGLSGDDIHIYGRITAIADVFDALGHDRVYKKAWELDRILELFKAERGKHFDPVLVDLFFENLEEFLAIKRRYDDSC